MAKVISTPIYMIFCCAVFAACSPFNIESQPTETVSSFSTPDIPNWGATPSVPLSQLFLPDALSCIWIPNIAPEPGTVSWRGLVIGKSTYDEVIDTFVESKEDFVEWNTSAGTLAIYNPAIIPSNEWNIASACFFEDTLAALKINSAPEFRYDISRLVEIYGRPSMVTWGSEYYTRSLIWGEKGLLIEVEMRASPTGWDPIKDIEGSGVTVLLFSPIDNCKIQDSWIYPALHSEDPPGSSEGGMIGSPYEDPWAIGENATECPEAH